MSLLDDASLLVTPNAEKAGKLYSIIPTNGNGDFSVTRATTATRVNAAGLVELVPYNLLTYSEMFSNAAWTKLNGSTLTPNTILAPNGTLTADTFQASNLAFGGILRSSITANIGTTYTFSFYAKKNNYRYVGIRFNTSVNGQRFPNYDFDTDTLNKQGVTCDLSRELLSNGWVRLVLTFTSISGGGCDIGITTANGDTATALTGTEKVDLWGAQAVEGTSALDYQMTETRLNIPRLDYSLGSCPNILLEPQRTNLALRSEEFENATWIKSRSVITANSLTSPSGVINASTITETTFTNNFSGLEQSIIVVSGTTYTQSIFVKKGNIDYFGLQYFIVGGANGRVIYDLNTKLTTNTLNIISSSITDFLNGWLRITMTYTANASAVNFVGFFHTKNSTSLNYNGNATGFTYAWGAQLEAGDYATSYIPTTSASVTRNADQISRGNIFTNGLITASGGTWFVDLRNNRALSRDGFENGLLLGALNSLNTIRLLNLTPGRYTVILNWGGTASFPFTTTADNCKLAFKFNGSTLDIFQNGIKVVSATTFVPTLSLMEFIQVTSTGVPKYINSMALFPTPLTDTQCIALTT